MHAGDFHHLAMLVHLACHIFAHGVAHLVVVAANVGGVAVAVCLAVEGNHGDAAVHHLLNGGRNLAAGDWRHNYHVDAVAGKLQ